MQIDTEVPVDVRLRLMRQRLEHDFPEWRQEVHHLMEFLRNTMNLRPQVILDFCQKIQGKFRENDLPVGIFWASVRQLRSEPDKLQQFIITFAGTNQWKFLFEEKPRAEAKAERHGWKKSFESIAPYLVVFVLAPVLLLGTHTFIAVTILCLFGIAAYCFLCFLVKRKRIRRV